MRRVWVVALLLAGLVTGVTSPAQAANVPVNAGFESGSLNGSETFPKAG